MRLNSFSSIATPDAIQKQINETPEVKDQISLLAIAVIGLLKMVDPEMDTEKISNIAKTLVSQSEIVTRLLALHNGTYQITKRLAMLMAEELYDDKNKQIIRKRAAELVDEQIFAIQKDVFFKIVNAKENAEGEKNEDGPAMFYPAVERTKNAIIKEIQSQADHLYPLAVDICKTFPGIASDYANTEVGKSGDKSKYDTISQAFEAEKSLRSEFIQDATSEKLRNEDYLKNLISAFEGLAATYIEKEESLNALDPGTVQNYDQKIAILKKGCEDVDKRLKPLRVLQSLAIRFPLLVNQLDFFAESHYQARAVLNVLEEVKEEMEHVFSRYNLESFTVISFLKFKLNGLSHMYECIHYYYATTSIAADVKSSLIRRFRASNSAEGVEVVREKLRQTMIPDHVVNIHSIIATMNDLNYDIHLAFLEYKEKKDMAVLRQHLKQKTDQINRLYEDVKKRYQTIQENFSSFLIDDLGATDIESQFNLRLKAHRELPEVKDVVKSFNMLLATKRGTIEVFEREFKKRFSEKLSAKQISAAAMLKVRKDFLKNLLKDIQSYSYAQQLYVEILKKFISGEGADQSQREADDALFWMIEKMSPGIMDRFKTEGSGFYKKILRKEQLTNRDLMLAFLADNITPNEIENFSRVLPGLPRNKLQLDTPYGRILLEISRLYHRQIQVRSGSAVHIMERVFEKRERQKLISNIHLMFRNAAEPFQKKVQYEEKKIDYLIMLQRWKFRKEFTQVIRFWQYLIQEQLNPGQGQRGYFRNYRDEEKKLIIKYISPDQLNMIEHQLATEFDPTADERLQNVDRFIFEIVAGLFNLFEHDDSVKAEFEDHEISKKIQPTRQRKDTTVSALENDLFVPLIKKRLAQKEEPEETAGEADPESQDQPNAEQPADTSSAESVNE